MKFSFIILTFGLASEALPFEGMKGLVKNGNYMLGLEIGEAEG